MRSLARVIAVAIVCAPFAAARAGVIVSGGAPSASVSGAAELLDLPDPLLNDGYDAGGSGDWSSGGGTDVVDRAISFVDNHLVSAGTASYNFALDFDGFGNLTSGTVDLGASASIILSTDVATDAGDRAWTRAHASALSILDFAITDVAVMLSVGGVLNDDSLDLGVDDLDDVLFTLADTTSGFDILISEADQPADSTTTGFAHELLLLPGHDYRMVLSTRTDQMCAETPGATPGRCALPPAPFAVELFGPDDAGVLQSASSTLVFTLTPVPEPGSAWLFAAGLAALGVRRRRA